MVGWNYQRPREARDIVAILNLYSLTQRYILVRELAYLNAAWARCFGVWLMPPLEVDSSGYFPGR